MPSGNSALSMAGKHGIWGKRLYPLMRPVVPRAELGRLSPTGIRLFERMLAQSSAGFPDQANKFPDGPT
jgi:hypothetical protein